MVVNLGVGVISVSVTGIAGTLSLHDHWQNSSEQVTANNVDNIV